jgi:hypothetical protein
MKWRRWPRLLAAVLSLLLLADAAVWLAAERALAARLSGWTEMMARQGVEATVGPARWGGFPLAASSRVALSLRAGSAVLRSDQVVLSLSPTQPGRLLVGLPASVTVEDPLLPPLSLASPDWRMTVRLDGSGVIATDARDLLTSWAGPGGVPQQVTAALLHLQATPTAESLDLVGSAQSIDLPEAPPGGVLPLGRHVASVAFEAVLAGRLSSGVAGWRASGGAVTVRRLAVGYGPLGLSGGGRLTLDAQLQPEGDAALTVLGYAETLDALVASHVLSTHAAQAAGAVLGLLARPPAGGGAPEVALNLTLRDRVLTAAGFPLLRLPRLGQ